MTEDFRADKWMNCLVRELGRGTYQAPKGQDSKAVVNLKRIRVHNLNEKIILGIESSREYANKIKYMEVTKAQNVTRQNSE